ncbi:hypothetical protein R2E40_09975 [Aeromonas sp. CD]|uniref:hypothetical protein n=1 Tax=Aeromonas sp. CD TaxID=3080830 RepID=UPI002966BBA5|nr:hypothetical protein [Aeromonas sp. CD]WOX54415.1 hypothetical protein R2E40_09975 [Aeromonas sp. CD]
MFCVSEFSKEAPFNISEYDYVFADITGKRTINIVGDVDIASILYKRIQKSNTLDLYSISINANNHTRMAFVIDNDTSKVQADYVFCFTSQEAKGSIPPIEKLQETNWLMLKHLVDSLAAAGLLNAEGTALKEQRDNWRQQIDTYGINAELSHEVTMVESEGVTIKPILDENMLNRYI